MSEPQIITTSGDHSLQPGDRITFGDGKTATVVMVTAVNAVIFQYTRWTRFKQWCWRKWHWRKLRDQEADLRRRYGISPKVS
jgi:hypothetical protein